MWEGPGKTKGLSHGIRDDETCPWSIGWWNNFPMTISQWVEKIKPMGCIFILSRTCHPLHNTCIMQYHTCTYTVSIVYLCVYISVVYIHACCMHVFHCFSMFLRFERSDDPALFFSLPLSATRSWDHSIYTCSTSTKRYPQRPSTSRWSWDSR